MEKIKISKISTSNSWKAHVGQIAIDMLTKKNIFGEAREKILNESIDILESCGDPMNETNDQTGLVIGYVQSGKTLSFTTVSALAAQNGFNVIIIIAGTTTSLVNQTFQRLANDLDINAATEVSWKTYKNPTVENREEVIADLEPGILNKNPVVLITVMKNSAHLRNLYKLFKAGIDNQKSKVLIIDDEADQASLNTKANKGSEDDVSTIYELIRNLKNTFNNHTYIQYTATPQAPLFISLLDILSPNFVKILTPGNDYTGGKAFFERNRGAIYPYVYDIPEEEIYSKDNLINHIPQSLVDAVMFFYISVVIGALNGEKPQTHNRTMMVHPSQLQQVHAVYERWIVRLKNRWIEELSLKDNDIDKLNLLSQFKAKYDELIVEEKNKHPFETILTHLEYVIRITPVILSNSSSKSEINFKKNYSLILVGGQVLDRGFTIEGLNVTYMPRSIGVGNADTLQQRCRFFGYKKRYLDLCRIYLPRRSKRAYIDYVTHEEDLRNKLNLLDKESRPLKEFKRMFILSRDLNITRKNVISDDIRRYRLSGWRPIQFIDPNFSENNLIYESFIQSIEFKDLLPYSDNATPIQKHSFALIDASDLIERLLLSLQHKNAANTLLLNHFLSLLSILVDSDQSLKIHLVNMSKGLPRIRSITEENKIKSVLQGANAKTNYPGDRDIISEDLITVQFHNIETKDKGIIFKTIAIHFPDNYAQNIITLEN
jgi:hypothetical protein